MDWTSGDNCDSDTFEVAAWTDSNAASVYCFKSGKLWSPMAIDILRDELDLSNNSDSGVIHDSSVFWSLFVSL